MKYKAPAKLFFNSDISYLIGVIQGDGNINKTLDKKGHISGLGLIISVGHDDKPYTIFLKKLIQNNLNYSPYVRRETSCYRVALYDRALVRAFERFKYDMRIPNFILSDMNLLSAYLQGLFDTDGCCCISSKSKSGTIDFSSNKKELITSIKRILEEDFDIYSFVQKVRKNGYRPWYRLYITNKTNILKFNKMIGFRHPRKVKKLKMLVKIYKNVPTRSIRNRGHEKIIHILKNNEMTTNDIAIKLNLHRETIKEHLEKMENGGIVTKRVEYFNRWGVVKYSKFKKCYWRLN